MTKKKRERRILAWHFCRKTRRLGYGDGRKIRVGETLSVTCQPALCECGLHASREPGDALLYGYGYIACRVQVWGKVQYESDKLVGQHRRCLAIVNAGTIIRQWYQWQDREGYMSRTSCSARLHKMLLAAIAAQKKSHASK